MQPERLRRHLRVFRLVLGTRIGWVQKHTDYLGRGYQVVQQTHSLSHQLGIELGYARGVATGPVQARREAKLDRISGRLKTIGMIVVAALAARAAVVLVATITLTCRRTRSCATPGSLSG